MVMTMALCVVVYVLFGMAATGINVMDQAELHDPDTALALAFKALGIDWITQVIYVAALFGAAAASLTNQMGQARVFQVMARDGLFFEVFGEINAETGVPTKGSLLQAIPICFISYFLDLTTLATLCSVCCLFIYSYMCFIFISFRLRGGS